MGTIVKKIKDLQYNELAVLSVIEKDADLLEIFQEDIRMPFSILYTLQKDGQLNDKTKELLVEIFESLILTKKDLIAKYLRLTDANGADVSMPQEVAEPTISVVDEAPKAKAALKAAPKAKETPKPKAEVKVEVTPKKEKDLPRRYGKASIIADIAKQGGKATPSQKAGIANNDVKNTYVAWDRKIIKNMLSDKPELTDQQCAEYEAAVIMFMRKANEILNPKRKK